jgi:hypothetical protein
VSTSARRGTRRDDIGESTPNSIFRIHRDLDSHCEQRETQQRFVDGHADYRFLSCVSYFTFRVDNSCSPFSMPLHFPAPGCGNGHDIVLSESSFGWCWSLESVIFESGSRLEQIERFAFCESGLKSIVIPSSRPFIAYSAFPSTQLIFSAS